MSFVYTNDLYEEILKSNIVYHTEEGMWYIFQKFLIAGKNWLLMVTNGFLKDI